MSFHNYDTSIEKEISNGSPNKIFEDLGLKLMLESKILCCVKTLLLELSGQAEGFDSVVFSKVFT